MLTFANTCYLFIANGSQRTDCPTTTTLKEWNHIVVTFDGKFSRAYTDGREVKVQESKFSKIDHGGKFYLRLPVAWGDKVEPTVTCMIDDVRVYNRALSKQEVISHYKNQAKAWGKNLDHFEKMNLQSHSSAVAREVVLEADFSGMELAMFAPGATLKFELIEPTSAKVVAHHEITNLPKSGKTSWTVSTAKLAPGDYKFRALVTDNKAKPFGEAATIAVKVASQKPAWARVYEKQNRLNNLVAELLSLPEGQKNEAEQYTFDNVRDGWVFISSTVRVEDSSPVVVMVDQDEVAVHTKESHPTIEAMRHLPAGSHTLSIRSKSSARLTKLVVRAIPEIIYAELGYEPNPYVKSYGPYTWEYLKKIGIIDNVNVILQRSSKPQNVKHMEQWRSRGKKMLYYYGLSWLLSKPGELSGDSAYNEWSTKAGLSSPEYYGLILDELNGHSYIEQYPAFTKALRKIAANKEFKDKKFYTYCVDMYESKASRAYTKVVLDRGFKLVEERYLFEQPTQEEARIYINEKLRLTTLRYQDYFDDCATKMIMNLGFISIPQQTQYFETGADAKVYMDMQMNVLANDPVFLGLYGTMWYHSGYADEELLRWAAKLYRHYCIEGKRERLTNDPYELPHIANGDFEQGTDRWKIEPAEDQTVSVERAFGYGSMQGRMEQVSHPGEKVLMTKRSAQRPNRISQTIKKLTPGRLYSLRMFIMDYGDFQNGKSVAKVHPFNITIDQVERIDGRSFREVFTNQRQVRPFTGDNRLHMTFCRIVFRAKRDTAVLTISDWAVNNKPGGPIGQQLAFNFIEVQPYLED
jgi:hypothetical protein